MYEPPGLPPPGLPPPGLPPPGWYPDPERPGAVRWWTGGEWSAPSASFTAPTDQLPETGAMLGGAFRRALGRWRALVVLGLLGGAVPAVLTILALGRLIEGLAIVDQEFVGWSNARLPGVIAMVAGAAVAGWIGWLSITWLMLRTYDAELDAGRAESVPPATIRSEVIAAFRALAGAAVVLPRAIGWSLVALVAALVAMVLVVALTVVAIPLGVLSFIVLIPLTVWVAVKAAFTLHAVVDAPGNPYARSWEVSAERFWPTLGRILLLGVVAGAINYGTSFVGSVASGASVGGPFGSGATLEVDEHGDLNDVRFEDLVPISTLGIVATAVSAVATTVVATSMMVAGYCELYRTRNPRPAR